MGVVTSGLLAVSDAADESIPMGVPPRSSLVIVDQNDTPRLADASEADEVGRLLHDFNTEFETPSPGADVLSERLAVLLDGESMFAILAGRPAFAVALVSVRPNVWYSGRVGLLDELYVDPSRRSEGTGSAILSLLSDHALTLGIDAIEINVDEGDIDAQRFYERHGYSSIEPETNERAFYYHQELRAPD
ncbi:GNAT family N-acetyltransferase [Ilumatobacter sp.]|uniref:GNAT family N-acetyltransferase n=1 Tax=Ilumatobacter sp. TaxID=1967498 RepID=UPI003B517B8B